MLAGVSGRDGRRGALAVSGLAAALCLAAGAGCSSACDTSDDGNPPERYTGGVVIDGVYRSSPFGGELLHFPGGKRYELVHGLGVCPLTMTAWLSFSASGIGPTFTGDTLSQCAGNACEFQSWNEQSVIIKNATCSEFWLLVTIDGRGGTLCDGGAPAGSMLGGDGAAEGAAEADGAEGAGDAADGAAQGAADAPPDGEATDASVE